MSPKRSLPRRILRALGALLLVLILAFGVTVLTLRHSLPEGTSGAPAGNLAHQVEDAVNLRAWKKTGAVQFTFSKRNEHLWDRARMLDRVRSGDTVVYVDIGKKSGRAFRQGIEVTGAEKDRLVDKAYRAWINDSFWLNPMAKLFDEGTSRYLTEVDGHPALLLRYGMGGVTPGDSYLYLLDDTGRPRAWRMYVSIIPIKGLETSWEGWTTLSTGALISTEHRFAGIGLRQPTLTDVTGAETLAALVPGPDPFAPLYATGH